MNNDLTTENHAVIRQTAVKLAIDWQHEPNVGFTNQDLLETAEQIALFIMKGEVKL